MTISTIGFTTWFTLGCYGGLASCAVAIAANVFYTTLRQRGTTRQLVAIVVICALAALLLLPAIIWFHLRFSIRQAQLSQMEIYLVLAYIAFCGWLLPIGATCGYFLFTRPRNAAPPQPLAGVEQPHRQPSQQQQSVPPRYQHGVPVPFVYGDDTPWGWLEYRTGSFQGQRLALKRAIITIGRDEGNEIWLDDDMASRYHAELTWHEGRVYLTDCESLNGVQLNGQRIQHSVLVSSNDLIEVGSHRFAFVLEEEPRKLDDSDDPLAHHKWRSALESLTAGSDILPATRPLNDSLAAVVEGKELADSDLKQTEEVDRAAPLLLPNNMQGALIICAGSKQGQSFRLNRPVLTVGRGIESDVIINDTSISRRHVQFLCQSDGDYVQDLVSRNGTTINGELLSAPRRLQFGDKVMIGNICLEYTTVPFLQTSSLTTDITPPPNVTGPISGVGLAPLRLPSRQKEE
jgi:pSer/pThr/pTyr-binding forkhead associated (FHA) protein